MNATQINMNPEIDAAVIAVGQAQANEAGVSMMLLVNRNNPTCWSWSPNLSPADKRMMYGDSSRKAAIAHPEG